MSKATNCLFNLIDQRLNYSCLNDFVVHSKNMNKNTFQNALIRNKEMIIKFFQQNILSVSVQI